MKSLTPLIALCVLTAAGHAAAPLRVDLGQDTGRSDTATPGWTEWQVRDGAEATRDFDGVKVTLRPIKEGELHGVFSKGLLMTTTLGADGVVVDGQGVAVNIEGLSPGLHTITTYHHAIGGVKAGKLKLQGFGDEDYEQPIAYVTPSTDIDDNADVAAAYVLVETGNGWPLGFTITSEDGSPVILNGFEIDGNDPNHKAKKPYPADLDWHTDADSGQLELTWTPAAGAANHHVFFVSDADPTKLEQLLSAAQPLSNPPFPKGREQPSTVASGDRAPGGSPDATSESLHVSVRVDPHASTLHYAWRVDSIDAAGKVTKGDVWSFRPRHLAFPTAEGYGRFAIGGRGGKVIKVTTLADSGPGSFRAALELNEPRTIIFDVSGRIDLKERVGIRNPYLTIAGQSAPGLGICISNYNLGMLGTHDVVIRYMRVRPGNTSGETLDGMGMASADHSIFDHCSISWTQDESFSSRGAHNITLQRTLISEALNIAGHKKYEAGKQHGYAASIGGDVGSFHHNLLAHCAGRNWSLAGALDKANHHAGRLDIRNNVVYNWGHRTTDGGAKQVNFVNNYYKPGPASRVFHVLLAQREAVSAFGPQMYYVEGNVLVGRFDGSDRMGGVIQERGPDEPWVVDKPFFPSYVATQPAAEAFDNVLADVGCNVPALDPHDQRVIRETRDGTTTYKGSKSGILGLPDTQDDVGGWDDYPEIHRGADWDQDNDGLPSKWETEQGLNPDDPADGNLDRNNDGYTNLEEYLNSLAKKPV